MDIFGRLSDYDVFAYLPQGFFVLAAFDFFFGTSFVIHASWDVPTGVFVLFLSYAAGHLVAGPASRILEAGIVHDMLKPPSVHLLSPEQRASWLLRSLLPAYFSPLSRPTRACVQAALAKAGTGLHGDEAYWVAYTVAKRDAQAKPRLENFLNVYGFCRNLSFIAAVTRRAAAGAGFGRAAAGYVRQCRPRSHGGGRLRPHLFSTLQAVSEILPAIQH